MSPEPALILGDEAQLEQVFLNLLNNGLDALPRGGKITILTEQSEGVVRVLLCDNGEGIPASSLSQIFRPFFTTKEVGRGTGLGLTIVKEILSVHGASIVAESEVGQGSSFRLEFPVAVSDVAETMDDESTPCG